MIIPPDLFLSNNKKVWKKLYPEPKTKENIETLPEELNINGNTYILKNNLLWKIKNI